MVYRYYVIVYAFLARNGVSRSPLGGLQTLLILPFTTYAHRAALLLTFVCFHRGGPSYQVLEWDSTPWSTIFGLTLPLLCSLISSVICFHDHSTVVCYLGLEGRRWEMRLVGILLSSCTRFLSFSRSLFVFLLSSSFFHGVRVFLQIGPLAISFP